MKGLKGEVGSEGEFREALNKNTEISSGGAFPNPQVSFSLHQMLLDTINIRFDTSLMMGRTTYHQDRFREVVAFIAEIKRQAQIRM